MKRSRIIQLICLLVTVCVFVIFVLAEKNKDTDSPEITMDEASIQVGIEDGDDVLLAGVKAEDAQDGDITDRVFIERIEKVKDGDSNQFTIYYVVYDQADNMTRASRDLYYTDYHQPHIAISQPLRFNVTKEQIYLRDYITVDDCIDGDITSNIRIKGEDQLLGGDLTEGGVECEIIVKNSLNDEVSLPVTVEIYSDSYEEAVKPEIDLFNNVVYVKKGESFNSYDNVQAVQDMGRTYYNVTKAPANQTAIAWLTADKIPFTGTIDVNVPGNYTGYYTFTSPTSGITVQRKLYVIVE